MISSIYIVVAEWLSCTYLLEFRQESKIFVSFPSFAKHRPIDELHLFEVMYMYVTEQVEDFRMDSIII